MGLDNENDTEKENDNQYEIIDEPSEEPRKRKRKSKSLLHPLGIPWRWVLVAFAAGVLLAGGALLMVDRITRHGSAVVAPTILARPIVAPIPQGSPTPNTFSGERIEDIAWHGDLMAAATVNRIGIYQDMNFLGNLNTYEFENNAMDKYIDLAISPDNSHVAAIATKYWFEGNELVPAAYVTIWGLNGAGGDMQMAFMAHGGNEGGFTGPYLGAAVAYSADGRWLATGAGKGEIKIWDTTDDYFPVADIFTFGTGTTALAFSGDNQRLTAIIRGDENDHTTVCVDCGSIQVWNISEMKFPYKEFEQHLQWEAGLEAAISPNGEFAAFAELVNNVQCCDARAVQIWNVHTGKLMFELGQGEHVSIEDFAFSPDSDSLTYVQKQLVGDQPGVMTEQVILVALGWEEIGDQKYRLNRIGSRVLQPRLRASQPHINSDATWLQYMVWYNIVERWDIQTGEMQDMGL